MTKASSEFLHGVPLFADLDGSELSEIFGMAQPFSATGGTVLFRQGEAADGMYLIETGRIRVSARLLGEGSVELSTFGAGEIVGELALVDRGARSGTAEALEPVSGYFFGNRPFELLRADLRSAAFKAMRRISLMVCQRLRTLNRELTRTVAAPRWADGSPLTEPPPESHATGRAHHNDGAAALFDRDMLATIPPFDGFRAAELEELVRPMLVTELGARETVISEGVAAQTCFIVVRGAVTVSVARAGGAETVSVLGPGKIFGHMALMDDETRCATCRTRERATLLAMDAGQFHALFHGGGSTAFKFFDAVNQALIGALRATNRNLGRLAAEGRLDRLRSGSSLLPPG